MATIDYTNIASIFGMPIWLLITLLIWSLVWKALSLWKAARKNHIVWFILLLIVNTFGILEILYLFIFSDLQYEKKTKASVKKKK